MQNMQNTLNNYVKTTGEPKGILIQRAGSNKAFTSLNNNSLKVLDFRDHLVVVVDKLPDGFHNLVRVGGGLKGDGLLRLCQTDPGKQRVRPESLGGPNRSWASPSNSILPLAPVSVAVNLNSLVSLECRGPGL